MQSWQKPRIFILTLVCFCAFVCFCDGLPYDNVWVRYYMLHVLMSCISHEVSARLSLSGEQNIFLGSLTFNKVAKVYFWCIFSSVHIGTIFNLIQHVLNLWRNMQHWKLRFCFCKGEEIKKWMGLSLPLVLTDRSPWLS